MELSHAREQRETLVKNRMLEKDWAFFSREKFDVLSCLAEAEFQIRLARNMPLSLFPKWAHPGSEGIRAVDIAKELGRTKGAITNHMKYLLDHKLVYYETPGRKNRIIRVNWERIQSLMIGMEKDDLQQALDSLYDTKPKRDRKVVDVRDVFKDEKMKEFVNDFLKQQVRSEEASYRSLADVFNAFSRHILAVGMAHVYPLMKKNRLKELDENGRCFFENLMLLCILYESRSRHYNQFDGCGDSVLETTLEDAGLLLPNYTEQVVKEMKVYLRDKI